MSGARHHPASAQRPVPGTTYDFLLAGQKILDAELIFGATSDSLSPLWRLPYGRHWLDPEWRNSRSYFHKRAWEQALWVVLDAIAAPPHVVPACLPRYADVLCRLADQFLTESQEAGMLVRESLNGIPSHIRVLAAAKAIAPDRSSTKAAEVLNLGHRCGDLTRDHVDRAWRRFLKDSAAHPQPGPAFVLTTAVVELEGLQFVLNEAQQQSAPSIRRLHGAELAESLDRVRRLATFLDRAPVSLRDFRGKVPAAA